MPTILCIDDEPNTLQVQKGVLEANGYNVLIAADGPTGIALASQHPVDLVVLDFKMPGMDGGQVAEALLKDHPELPVVICTGFLDAVPEWLRWFAAAFVEKGDGPAVLLATTKELIGDEVPAERGGASRGTGAGGG